MSDKFNLELIKNVGCVIPQGNAPHKDEDWCVKLRSNTPYAILLLHQIVLKSSTNPGNTSSPLMVVGNFKTSTSCPNL